MPNDFASAATLKASSIPVVDISAALESDGLESVAEKMTHAATNVGFFYITGHGIDLSLMERAFAVARDFFALTEEEKRSVAVDETQRGWMAGGMSHLEGASTHDLKEVFFWGAETAADDADLLAGKPLVAMNRWPDEVFPRLETELVPYYNAVCETARHVLSALAMGLGASPDFFDPHYRKPLARGQIVYYPPSTAEDEAEERFGVAPHSDFGVLTLLLQDQQGGLQVRRRNGEWVEAPPIPGSLICNVGDLLQRWSNDRLVSTRHRVINRSGRERYSIPVFFDPHTDTQIDPCDLGVGTQESRYAPVAAGVHIAGRNSKSFAQFQRR